MDNQSNAAPQPHTTTLYDLMKEVLLNDQLDAEQKKKLIDELRKNNPGAQDRWTYRWAIWILGTAVLLTITLIYFLRIKNIVVPESLIAIGSTVAGGVMGLLSPTQRSRAESK